METESEVLNVARNAIDDGCVGCIIGRNIWQHIDPVGMVQALKKVIHADISPKEALKEI